MAHGLRLVTGTILMVVVYFAVPVQADGRVGIRILATAICVVLVGLLIARQTRRIADAPLTRLALTLVLGLLSFAMADYLIAISGEGEFVGLRTRLDALYFAVTTLGTVGFGDVHAQSGLARGVVTLQILFNLLVLATGGSLLVSQLKERRSSGGKSSSK